MAGRLYELACLQDAAKSTDGLDPDEAERRLLAFTHALEQAGPHISQRVGHCLLGAGTVAVGARVDIAFCQALESSLGRNGQN